jgi:putative ABC transport system permease protein
MILATLAFRNVLRQRRRTLLTLLVLVAGYVATALAGGFMAQTFDGLSESAIRGGLGHVQIQPRQEEALDDAGPGAYLPNGESLADKLRQDPQVQEVLPRLQFMGLASNGTQSVAFLGLAVEPEREARFMDIRDRLEAGALGKGGKGTRWLSPDPNAREVVLGVGLARSLHLEVGSTLTLMATTPAGALNAVDVEVVGLQDQGVKELNDRSVCTSVATGSALLDLGSARSALSVVLNKPQDAATEASRLANLCGSDCQGKPWFELASFYRQVKLLYFAIFGFMGLVLSVVVLLATANTLLMSVMERMRELGTLRALGLQPNRLVALLQWEGAFLGLGGSTAGVALTLLLRATLNALHLQMPAPPGSSHGYELNIHLVPGVYAIVFIGAEGRQGPHRGGPAQCLNNASR